MMMSAMPMANVKNSSNGSANVSNADVNGALGYYHCSDGPKYVCGYNDLPSRCYYAVL
jgi:hypothetical protein